MISPSYSLTATERVLPRMALDFTTATLDSRVTFTRTGNTATVTNSSGVIVGINADLPRFDFDPTTLICKGLLIEELRTNALLNSLIDGTSLATQLVTVTAAARTLSFYGTGTVVLSGAHSATVVGTGAYPTRTTLTFTPSAGVLTLTVTGTVQFAQLETGAFATSYIPTAATAVTRNADNATMTGTNFSDWYNATEGALETVSTTISTTQPASTGASLYLDGTNFMATFFGDVNKPRLLVRNAGVFEVNTTASVAQSNPFNQVFAYKSGSISFASNATLIVNSVNKPIPSPNSLYIGSHPAVGAAGYANAWISRVAYWPQRLINNEVIAFSK